MTPMKISDENLYYGSLYMRFDEVRLQRQQVRCTRPLLHIRKMCVCVVAVLFASISAFGLTATVDGIKWTYTVSNGKASVGEGTSSTPAVSTSTSGAITIPSSLGGYSVTSIGDYAFCGCSGLMSVTIPDSVTSIGRQAFGFCSELANVVIGSGVTSIGDYAFAHCGNLKSVEFKGNAPPYCYNSVFYGIASGCEVIVPRNSTGWGVREGELWHGLVLRYASNVKWEIVNGELRGVELNGETAIIIPSSVTSIGDYAFCGCSGLMSVTIPDSVTSIGRQAFGFCSELANVVIGSGVTSIGDYAFAHCGNLKSVEFKGNAPPYCYNSVFYGIASGCEVIVPRNSTGWGVREGELWHGLVLRYASNVKWEIVNGELRGVELNGETAIIIPSSVTSIGDSAFYNCSGLTNVVIGSGVITIGNDAFHGCRGLTSITIPDSVTRIGDYAFCYCRDLTSITIPASVTSIGAWAFAECNWVIELHISDLAAWCKSLPGYVVMNPHGGANLYLNGNLITALTIPASVTSIKSYAFYCCNGFTSVTIPDSVTSIGSFAFSHCHDLTSVKIGNGVKSIGDGVFQYCGRLLEISVSEGNEKFQSVNGLLLTKDGKTLIQGVNVNGDVTIPDSVTSIGACAFYNCSRLTSVVIGNGVTSIGDSAFYNCSGLASVTIPDSVTSIGSSVFYGCSGLTSVTIGNGVTDIGDRAFEGCCNLTSVTIPDSVTKIGASVFYNCSDLTRVTFLGDAPAVDSYTFYGVNASCVALVSPKSTGWGVGVGEKWKGLTLQYWPEILTVASSDTEVGAIVATFADKGFAAQVTNKVEYDAFRAWVNGNNLYQPNVVKSTRTWLSYALGADALIGKEITSNDVRIVAFEATNADSGAMGSSHPTSFAFEVATDGVNIGGGMVAVETLKENLKKVLDVEGATTLSPDAFSSDNIEITFDTPVDGKARFIATPPANAGNTFFMRVKVK